MRVVLTGRHVDITPALRKLVDRKTAKLDRIFGDALVSAQIVLAQEKYRRIAEVVAHIRGDHVLHGAADDSSWEQSLTAAVEKIIKQGEKIKGKWQESKRRKKRVETSVAAAPVRPVVRAAVRKPSRPRIVRSEGYADKAMTVDEAVRAASAAQDGFFVFRNSSTDSINVLYLRKDGDFGLIEPEA